DKYKVDISCLEYEVLRSKQGEFFISTEKIVGFTEVGKKHKSGKSSVARWSGPAKVKDVIRDAVMKITGGDKETTFSPVDVYKELIQEYPDINQNTVGCQIIQDCVNHTQENIIQVGRRICIIVLIKAYSGFTIQRKMENGILRERGLILN
ncbi:MAG: DUF7669 domain-containing protein, partial [Bacillota bacterium]